MKDGAGITVLCMVSMIIGGFFGSCATAPDGTVTIDTDAIGAAVNAGIAISDQIIKIRADLAAARVAEDMAAIERAEARLDMLERIVDGIGDVLDKDEIGGDKKLEINTGSTTEGIRSYLDGWDCVEDRH